MQKRRFRPAVDLARGLETLEARVVLSTVSAAVMTAVASKPVHKAATTTSLAISPATLGQPITFNVNVSASASAGSPQGTVRLIQHGQVFQTLTLAPSTSTTARSATSQATYTLAQQPGGTNTFFGKFPVTAQFVPASGAYSKSSVNKVVTVSQPTYTALAGGTQVATVVNGSGAAVQTGQTANILYTGYLAKNGAVFDSSVKDGGAPFSFTVGSGQVIPGFDAGTVGMKVGETRVVEIPPSQGYGSSSNGTIPANSTLIFVLTLESIS